jgi:hypothetical protein
MKFVTLSFFIVTLSISSGLRNFRLSAEFLPCQTEESLNTLWPDFSDSSAFFKCARINEWTRYICPDSLLFRFDYQVCVWKHDWVPPPNPEEITPFPPTDNSTTTIPIRTTLSSDPTTTVELVIFFNKNSLKKV